MRPELDGKKGAEYFAAWNELMRSLGDNIKADIAELLKWAGVDPADRKDWSKWLNEYENTTAILYAVLCARYDLPFKTTVEWLEREHAIPMRTYDYLSIGNLPPIPNLIEQARELDAAREQGQTWAQYTAEIREIRRKAREKAEAERQAKLTEIERKEQAKFERAWPPVPAGKDREGQRVIVGDYLRIYSWAVSYPTKVLSIREDAKHPGDFLFEIEYLGIKRYMPNFNVIKVDQFFGETPDAKPAD